MLIQPGLIHHNKYFQSSPQLTYVTNLPLPALIAYTL